MGVSNPHLLLPAPTPITDPIKTAAHVVGWIGRLRDGQLRARGEVVCSIDAENAQEVADECEEFEDEFLGVNHDDPYDWRRRRGPVDKTRRAFSTWTCIWAMVGMSVAIAQNELIMDANLNPKDTRIEILKLINSFVTLLAVGCLIKYYQMQILFDRIYMHLHYLKPLNVNVSWTACLMRPACWLEICVIVPHCPPFFTTSFGISSMRNFFVYRVETLLAVYNMLRCYTLWRCFVDVMMYQMPKRHTISNFSGVPFDWIFAFKKSLDGWSGVAMVMALWSMSILFVGYVFRVAESTACLFDFVDHPECATRGMLVFFRGSVTGEPMTKDAFPANSFWMMFVTTTTVGYGDVTVLTHMGRFACVLIGILGNIFAALLTASLSNALQWSTEEATSLMVLERERSRQEVRCFAANRIRYWWKQRQKNRKNAGWSFFRDLWETWKLNRVDRSALLRSMHQCSVDVDDLSDESKKIDYIHHRIKYMHNGLRSMKCSFKKLMLESPMVTLTTKQEIKMGFIGYELDDEKFDDSIFKANTELSLQQHLRGMEKRGQGSDSDLPADPKLPRGAMKRMSMKDMKAKSRGWQSKFASHTLVMANVFIFMLYHGAQKTRRSCQTVNALIACFKSIVLQLTDQFMSTIHDKIARTEEMDFEWYKKVGTIDERKVLRNRQAGLFG